MTATPRSPAGYLRHPDDPNRAYRLTYRLHAAAERLGWPEPAIYADAPAYLPAGGIRQVTADPASAPEGARDLARLLRAIRDGTHDAVILPGLDEITRDPADLIALADWCAARHVPAVLPGGLDITAPGAAALLAVPIKPRAPRPPRHPGP